MFRSLFALFLFVPLIEIYFLIQVGRVIGAGWTIFLVVATAVIGISLLRMQGLHTMQRAQLMMAKGQLPAVEMFEGIALVFSGAFLMTPGFVTDSFGFILLVPAWRRAIIKQLIASPRFTHHSQTQGRYSQRTESTIIEGEIIEDDEKPRLK